MAMIQGQPPPYSEAQVITNVVGVSEPNLLALAAAQNTRLPEHVPEEPGPSPENDANLDVFKQKIYRHSLFPLLAMVFEKCENATSFPDSSSTVFEKELKACMKCLEGLDQPLMDDDEEVNQLMLKAIQVFRIHLMEVEKVNELCKDFCGRYITCLKSKLTSESLLHVEGCDSPPPLDASPTPGMMATSPTIQLQTSPVPAAAVTPTVVGGGVMLQQQQPQQPQIVSGNTVYQMVRTPQGIVAQPIQIQGPLTPLTTSTQSAIHGSTPLSQVGLAALGSPTMPQTHVIQPQQQQSQQSQQHQPQQLHQAQQQQISGAHQLMQQQNDHKLLNLSAGASDDVDDEEKNSKQKRGVLPKQATQIMKSWLFQHIVHPYPTEDEKRQIASQTNLTLLQVNNWFINARRRILQPMLEVSNPDKGKVKKPNKTTTRPQHRFWPVQSDSSSEAAGAIKIEKEMDGQKEEALRSSSNLVSRAGQVSVIGGGGVGIIGGAGGFVGGMGGTVIDNSGMTIQSDSLMGLVQNAGLVLKVGLDGQLVPTTQVAPPPPSPASISLENLQALQSSGLLFAPGASPLNLNLPFNGLTPVGGAGLAGFGMAGGFPGLAAAAAAASIMNFNPAAAAAAYAPLSFANLNATPIDLSGVSHQSTPIQLINGATSAAQINPQLQMHMGLSYQGISMDQSGDMQEEESGQLHIDMENNGGGMGDGGD